MHLRTVIKLDNPLEETIVLGLKAISSLIALTSIQLQSTGTVRTTFFKPTMCLDGPFPEAANDYPFDREFLPSEQRIEGTSLTSLRRSEDELGKLSLQMVSETKEHLRASTMSSESQGISRVHLGAWGQSEISFRILDEIKSLKALRRTTTDHWLEKLVWITLHWSTARSNEFTIQLHPDHSVIGILAADGEARSSGLDVEVLSRNVRWMLQVVRTVSQIGVAKDAIEYSFDGPAAVNEVMKRLLTEEGG